MVIERKGRSSIVRWVENKRETGDVCEKKRCSGRKVLNTRDFLFLSEAESGGKIYLNRQSFPKFFACLLQSNPPQMALTSAIRDLSALHASQPANQPTRWGAGFLFFLFLSSGPGSRTDLILHIHTGRRLKGSLAALEECSSPQRQKAVSLNQSRSLFILQRGTWQLDPCKKRDSRKLLYNY